MELNNDIYEKMIAIDWFCLCGSLLPIDTIPPVQRVPTMAQAVASALAPTWQDVRTEAQGDLTGFLAKHHADAYDYWNSLARTSRQIIQQKVMPKVNDGLANVSASVLADSVLLDLNRIALHSAYAKRFRKLPNFFSLLSAVYQQGHLPCGWAGSPADWPRGQFLVY